MVNMIFCILFQTMPGPVQGICFDKMLTPYNEKTGRRERVLIWSLFWLVINTLRIVLASGRALIIINILMWTGYAVLLHLLYKDRTLKKWKVLILFWSGIVLSDVFITMGLGFFTEKGVIVEYTRGETVILCAIVNSLAVLWHFVLAEMWSRRIKKETLLEYPIAFVGLVVTAVLSLLSLYYQSYTKSLETIPVENFIIYTVMFFGLVALAMNLINQKEKKQVAAELSELRRLSELEQVHYQEIEKRREEMAKIRHDYNNLLTSALLLLHAGKSEEAEQLFSELSRRIEHTREYPYCGIPIINAILSEKEEICRESGIRLTAELMLPEELPVSNFDLCSALGNLMDNAIRACRKIAESEIRLSCGIANGYLVVKAVNPAEKEPDGKPEGTGYGLKILGDLAKRYHGDFFTEYKDGMFVAQLSLRV